MSESLTTEDVLGPEGHIARRLPAYESRPEQLALAEAVAEVIDAGEHLIAEAGTGVGKSFAYLVPSILEAARPRTKDVPKKPIIVSTHTISLQEQLIDRDVPFLNAVLPIEFSAVLAKGRSNYLSLRRLKGANQRVASTLIEQQEQRQLRSINQWVESTGDGSLKDLDFRPLPTVWDEVRSEHGNCLGRKCPTYDDCFYYKARRRVANADLVIVNHALFFADLNLRRDGASILPDYDVVIFDEAHTLEAVAGNHLGLSVSDGQFTYLFNKLYNERSHKGLLRHHQLNNAEVLVARLRMMMDTFFDHIRMWRESSGTRNGRVYKPLSIENVLSSAMQQLAAMLTSYASKLKSDEEKIELTSAADSLTMLAGSLNRWLHQQDEGCVYWVEQFGRNRAHVKLICSPIDVGPVLRDELFNRVKTAVLTSATLSVGNGNFDFLRGRLGLTKSREIALGSPFDYRRQARLILSQGMPEPSAAREYEAAVCDRIRQHILETDGRAFVLFTSYRMLQNCADRLTSWCAEHNFTLLTQGGRMQRSQMLEKFRDDGRAVLFGTESFWQGVDVPGDALQNVIITKLPFSVPDQPLLEARIERIRERGGNPFMEYQVPEAVIKLKQGFGRLIRSKTDTGQVVILDPRVRTKPYGRLFLASLPQCEMVEPQVR